MLLTLLEVVFVSCIVAGVGLWSVPLALVVAGVLGVAACEVAGRRVPRPADPSGPPR